MSHQMKLIEWINRIEAVRGEAGIDSSKGGVWTTFVPRLRKVANKPALPIGPLHPDPDLPRDWRGRWKRAS